MWIFGAAYQAQVNSFVGGAKAFGVTVAATAEAMRALVGPTDRLDTYGGYVTFHNLGYACLALGFWALVLGSGAIRGAEERGELPGWLAAGRARWLLLVDRALGFLAAMALVAIGVGVLTWFGTLAAGEPQLLPSFGAIAEVALAASVFFALALLLSQLVASSRTSSGIAAALMLATYLAGNLNEDLGWWSWVKYLSPFWYAQQSRVLIPAHTFNVGATLALAGAFVVLTSAAAVAFSQRDVGAPLWTRRTEAGSTQQPFRRRQPWLATPGLADLAWQRGALVAWFAGTTAWFALYVAVTPTILKYWTSSDLIQRITASIPSASLADQYISYVVNLTAPLVAAFALVQAARWVKDSEEHRTDLELVCPVSRRRLWLERMAALTAGALVVTAGCTLGMVLGALAAGVTLDAYGVARAGADLLLLAMATGAVGALVVATLRSSLAIGVLGGFLGLSFFVTIFGPLLSWPEWAIRLSVFQAFGAPYAGTVAARDALFVAGVAVIGTAAALIVASRRSTAP